MSPLLQQFIQESREALDAIGQTLLQMEREPDNAAPLGELFRLVHTLKGNSGLFEFPALTSVLHAAEDLMDALRNGALAFNQQLADQLLGAADYVGEYLDEVESQEQPGSAFRQPPKALIEQLRGWLGAAAPVAAEAAPAAAAATAWRLPEELPHALRLHLAQELEEGRRLYWVDYRPAAECFFHGTDPLHLVRQLPEVLWRRISPCQAWPDSAELDAYRCNLRFELLLPTDEARLAEQFRYASDQVSWQPVDLAALGLDQPAPRQAPPAEALGLDPLALDILRTQRLALAACLGQPWPSGQQAAIQRTLENLLDAGHDQGLRDGLRASLAQAHQQAGGQPLLDWLDGQLSGAPARAEQLVMGWLANQLDDSTASGAGTADAGTGRRGEEAQAHATPRVLKIEQEKIDRLMNLIGEIVVAKNGLPYLAERAEQQYGQRDLSREIKAQYAVVNRIAEDLQDAIMQVRMMPVSFILQRFPRLVRDTARKLGKKVSLVLEGEETEADKAMIEALAAPLVHVVRNALDHGLEPPAERSAAGKPETGTLRIRASQNADHVVILIDDDGRGIDPQRIKAKVAEKGLVDPATLDAMGEQELVNLVFLPGFSTAEQISDLSGRGVGMDVVRSAIEKVGGQLRLSSQLGSGTQLSLSLPLSMAVTQVMVIESGGQRFGIPMDQVMETVRLPQAAIRPLKQQQTAQLRGRTIPLKSLNQLLALDAEQRRNEDDEQAVMVLRNRSELAGLVIDDFHGSVDIILKPMLGILGELPGYSGTAVMGDGSILMILNPMELFQ
ncbi:chemotaxis protein CheA [Pseudomonas guguanensis]|uniref:chemotaxis protein CheA n=1 Tax=Ectopseudomonas guguanensis TaxID=1198456 RepID=UPI003264E346